MTLDRRLRKNVLTLALAEEREIQSFSSNEKHPSTPSAGGGASGGEPISLPRATCAIDVPPLESIEWIVEGLFTAGDPAFLFGDGGDMKTTLALHIGCAVAGGAKVFGQFQAHQRAVLCVSAEDSLAVLRMKLIAMIRGQFRNADEILQNFHFLALEGANLSDLNWRIHLINEVTRLDAGLVILDPLRDLVTGDENSSTEMSVVVAAARAMAKPTGAAILFCHHAGKAGQDRRPIDRIRGSSVFYSAARAAYMVTNDASDHTLRIQCLKLSRAERLEPFAVRYVIEADPSNRAMWETARFEYTSTAEAELNKADAFVLELLTNGRLSTTEIKQAGKGSGVNAVSITKAIQTLEMRRIIDFVDGPNRSKLWGRKPLAGESGQVPEPPEFDLPGKSPPCRGKCA